MRTDRPGSYLSFGALFLNPESPILFREHKMKVGSHLQRPAIVEGSYDDCRGVAEILKGIVAADPDLAWFVNTGEDRGKPGRGIHVSHSHSIIRKRNHVSPYHSFARVQQQRLVRSLDLGLESSRMSF